MKKFNLPFSDCLKSAGLLLLLILLSNPISAQICGAQADFPFQEWINNVTFGDLSNLNSGKFRTYASAGYSDYTDLTPTVLAKGTDINYQFDIGNTNPNPGDYWTAFIDYNQNGVFDLPEENIISARGSTINGTTNIPASAVNGTTRLRIILSSNDFSGPCDNPAFGEVEDYLVEISEANNSDDQIDLELNMSATNTDPEIFSRSRVTLTLTNNSSNQATNIRAELFLTAGIDDFVFAGDGDVALTGSGTFSIVSGAWNIPSLAGGATATVSFDLFTLSDDFSPCAQVRSVDQEDIDSSPGNAQCPNAMEDDEATLSDNPPTQPVIDFVLESLDFPSSGFSGSEIEGEIIYSRLGDLTGFLFIIGNIYLSEDDQLDADDIFVGSANLNTNNPFTNNTRTLTFNLEGIVPGDYTLFVVLDEPNDVEEFNESNNTASIPFSVLPIEVPECNQVIGGEEILCSENIGPLTRLYIREGKTFFTTDLDQEANIVATSPTSPLVYDSTLIKDGILTQVLADGTIDFTGNLPTVALDFIPNPTIAARLSTGEFVIAGNVPQGTAGNEPFAFETRVLKLDANLNNVLTEKVLAANDLYPANSFDKVHGFYPLENGEVTIVYSIFNLGITTIPNIQLRHLDSGLEVITSQTFTQNALNGITETPCGDLLLDAAIFQVAQKSSVLGSRRILISKDVATIRNDWSTGVIRIDRIAPREFSNFSTSTNPEFFLNYNTILDNPPTELTGNLPQSNGDTTQITFPFFEFNYGTRNGNSAILYGTLNGQMTAVTNDCGPTTTDGVDLAVSLEVSNENPTLFSKIFYQVTVQNLGNEAATNVSIDFDYGAQETPKRLAFVSSSDPEYSGWQGIWNAGSIPAGAAKTFSLEVFVLSAAGPSTTLTAALNTMDQEDLNGSNDESSATINLGASTNEASAAEATITTGPRLSMRQLFPNPAQEMVTIVVESKEVVESTALQLFNTFGKIIREIPLALNPGINFVEIPITELQEGTYLVVVPDGSHQHLMKRFIKIR